MCILEGLFNLRKLFQVSSDGVSKETVRMSSAGCQHQYKVDEEIGVLCHICGFVLTEIRDVSPPFVSHFRTHKMHFVSLLVFLPAFIEESKISLTS